MLNSFIFYFKFAIICMYAVLKASHIKDIVLFFVFFYSEQIGLEVKFFLVQCY